MAVNALSDWLELEIRRGGKVYYQKSSRGVPLDELRQTGTTQSSERHGSKTTFHLDPDIFKNRRIEVVAVSARQHSERRGVPG